MSQSAETERDGKADEAGKDAARDAALYDPDSVFHDHAAQTTAGRALEALTAVKPEPVAPEPAEGQKLYGRGERRRAGALTPEMIKRIADRAEQAAAKAKK